MKNPNKQTDRQTLILLINRDESFLPYLSYQFPVISSLYTAMTETSLHLYDDTDYLNIIPGISIFFYCKISDF